MTGSGTLSRIDPFVGPLWHHLVPTGGPGTDRPTELVRGSGIYLWDASGNRYMDGTSTMGAVMVGHGRPELAEAAADQMLRAEFVALTSGWSNGPAVTVAKRLLSIAGQEGGAVWLQNSGSEAVEAAIRIALNFHLNRGDDGRRLILTCENGYHGVTLGAAAATGNPDLQHFIDDAARSFVRLPQTPADRADSDAFVAELEATIGRVGADRIAAFIAEPIPTPPPAGVRVPPDDHWAKVQSVLSAAGILLIFDEVFDGFGRTGRMLAQQWFDVRGDLTTVSKGLTSGYLPLSAVVVSEAVAAGFSGAGAHALKHGGTYSGHPVPCAVALRNIDLIESEDLVTNAVERGKELRSSLERIAAGVEFLGSPSGTGLLYSLPVKGDEPDLVGHSVRARCREDGLLLSYARGLLYLFPPLVVTAGQVDEVGQILERAMVAVAGGYRY